MRLLAVFVTVAFATKPPSCTQGLVYSPDIEPWNSSVTQEHGHYTCYFRIYYKVSNLSDCDLHDISARADFVREATAQNKTGECFYSYERQIWGNRRYLQCQCEEDGCNSHIHKIRPMLDVFHHGISSRNKTIEEELLLCIGEKLNSLGLFPLPPGDVTSIVEDPIPVNFRRLQWELLLLAGSAGLLSLLVAFFLCKKCCRPRRKTVRYGWWNVFDPEERGVCLPSDSKEALYPAE